MGKPDSANTSADAISLHSQPGDRYYDDDAPELPPGIDENDDLPPLYEDVPGASTSASEPLLFSDQNTVPNPTAAAAAAAAGSNSDPTSAAVQLVPFKRDEYISYFLNSNLDTDPDYLEQQVRQWAAWPPRPFVRIHGHHREQARERDNRKTTRNVTDFDISVELTPYLCPSLGLGTAATANCTLDTAEDTDKVRRGGVCRTRARRARRGGGGRVELGMVEKPTLAEWCHRYCATHSPLKTFQLRRRMVGFNETFVREQIAGLVRTTNYQGALEITFPVRDEKIEVWSECRINEWRLTKAIYVIFCMTFLWIFTWPYLFLRTKKFETVTASWHFSSLDAQGARSYATIAEHQWYSMWAKTIKKAVLSKRQGTLDQQDLRMAEAVPSAFNTGNTAVDGALGVLQAGINAMNTVNQQMGWGGHQA